MCKCINYYGTEVATFFVMINKSFKKDISDKEYYLSPIMVATFNV